ncbi:MAG: tetratricopeptide repeat protein [Gemmataceae bacterium]|nr:tetratricopeptide repeat protein [Gemmataceae bacterium]
MSVETIFAAAAQKPLGERAAYLNEACGTDEELRRRVERLLRAHDAAGDFLESPAEQSDGTSAYAPDRGPQTEDFGDPTARVGSILVGKYKLIEEIGEGGMGSVYMAQQTEPVKRAVAVKVIKAGMDSKAVLARFEAERQALAMMDHPNIAKVLDAGTTEGGRPFFVMELVKGTPITQYCDDNKLTPRQRLELFVPVCQAIQHAHQKGVIHRDIKPSNVLVAPYDDRPVPKVIDFGVAKAAGQALTDKTLMTGYGAIVGTAEYMSPEQANLNNQDIDTRSDVYSLGVLLYELLTGTTPVDRKSLGQAAILEILRIVREVEAPKPSARLSTIDTLPSVAANRGTEPARLSNLIRGELDWVVLKALEKDRTRRYETANGLARDIQRYLSDEPVEACPPSATYRLRKFVQRNRGQVIAASLVLLALVGGMVGTTVGLIEATKQEKMALAAAEKERKAKQEAEAEKANALKAAEAEKVAKLDADARREEAIRNLAFAKMGNELLGSVFTGLDPKKIAESGRPLQDMLRENLVKAVKELEGSAIGDPLDVARMQYTLGRSLLGLGDAKLAVEVLEKARATFTAKLGPDHSDTLDSLGELAVGYQEAGRISMALPIYEETLSLRKAKHGPNHSRTLSVMNNLALCYRLSGRLDKAMPLLEETHSIRKAKLGPDHPDTLTSMNNLALGYLSAGQFDKAQLLFEEGVSLQKTKLGPDHPSTLAAMGNLAQAYTATGRVDKALPIQEETLKLLKAKLGPDHPSTLQSMNNLAIGYHTAGLHDKALPLLEESIKLGKAKLGPDHPNTLHGVNNLAAIYLSSGKLDKAVPLLEETLKIQKTKLGPDHPSVITCMNNLAASYFAEHQWEKALPLSEEALKLSKSKLGPEHPDTLHCMNNLALAYLSSGQQDKALPLFRECLILRKKTQPEMWSTFQTQSLLGAALLGQKKYADAEPLLLNGYEGLKAREKTMPPQGRIRIPEALDRLIELYTATNQPDEVKKYQELRAKYPPPKEAAQPSPEKK